MTFVYQLLLLIKLPVCFRLEHFCTTMAAPSISHSGSADSCLTFEDYSLYSNLSDSELLQLAIERSLIDMHGGAASTTTAISTNSTTKTTTSQRPHCQENKLNPSGATSNQPPAASTQNPAAAQTVAHYSSPNPPVVKPPDPYVVYHLLCTETEYMLD